MSAKTNMSRTRAARKIIAMTVQLTYHRVNHLTLRAKKKENHWI